jgi:hypothetical protein
MTKPASQITPVGNGKVGKVGMPALYRISNGSICIFPPHDFLLSDGCRSAASWGNVNSEEITDQIAN